MVPRGLLLLVFVALVSLSCANTGSNPSDAGGAGYTVSGRVLAWTGSGAADVLVKITGISRRDSVHTDAEGRFSFTGVTSGTWLVTLSAAGLTFTPENSTVKVKDANIALADFTSWPGSGALADHSGDNRTVTILNVVDVASMVNTLALGVFQKAIAPYQADPTALIGLLGTLALTANGDQSGIARITGTVAPVLNGFIPTGFSCALNTAYFDYSDDGRFFIGGSMVFTGAYTYTAATFPLNVVGDVRFNGSYAGAEKFTADFTVDPIARVAPYTVTLTMTSGAIPFEYTFSGTAKLP